MADAPGTTEPSLIDILWDKVSSRLNASGESVQKIKFGRGAVGKISVITVAALATITAIALRLGANAAYLSIAAVTIIVLASFGLIFYIVCKRPQLAVMEGAELVQYQHVQLAAKGYIPSPTEPQIQLPGTETFHLPGGQEDSKL